MKIKRPVILLGGVSGAGVTTALAALEDMGYEAFTLPLYAVPDLLRHNKTPSQPLAIRVDPTGLKIREQKIILDQIERMRGNAVRIVFLDCNDAELAQRFVRTRRRHPLGLKPLTDNLFAMQRAQMKTLRFYAELEINTSFMAAKRLRQIMAGHFGLEKNKGLAVDIVSFSIPGGIPMEANNITDLRFLHNPFYVPALQKKTGKDRAVGKYIFQDPDFTQFFRLETERLALMLSRLQEEEGLNYYVLAYGCTGGQHRSVFVAEAVATWLRREMKLGFISVYHRELEKK